MFADGTQAAAGTVLNDALQNTDHLIGAQRINDLFTIVLQLRNFLIFPFFYRTIGTITGIMTINCLPLPVLNTLNQIRRNFFAAVDHDTIGRCHIDKLGFTGAERHRQKLRQIVVNPHFFGVFGNLVHADVLRQTNSHQVAGFFNSLTQRQQPVEFFGIVGRLPNRLSGALIQHKRRIKNQIRRFIAVFESRQINNRLKGRTGLAFCLSGAVVLGFLERVTADHCQNFAGVRIHGHHCALNIGKLPQIITLRCHFAFFDILGRNFLDQNNIARL